MFRASVQCPALVVQSRAATEPYTGSGSRKGLCFVHSTYLEPVDSLLRATLPRLIFSLLKG